MRHFDWSFFYYKQKLPYNIAKEKFNNMYEQSLPFLNEMVKLHQKSWDEFVGDFSSIIESKTKINFREIYFCVISLISEDVIKNKFNPINDYAPIIVQSWEANHFLARREIAEKLLLVYYFDIIQNQLWDLPIEAKQLIARSTAIASTSMEKFQEIWPWDEKGYYHIDNNPYTIKIQNQLKNLFFNEKDFDKYLQASFALLKSEQ